MDKRRMEFVDSMVDNIVKFSKQSIKEKQPFEEGAANIITDIQHVLACAVCSAAITTGMDREKFIIYANEVGNEIKKISMKMYNEQNDGKPR